MDARKIAGLAIILPFCAALACGPGRKAETPHSISPPHSSRVKSGLEVLVEKHLDLLKGKRYGLVTNPSAVDAGLRSAVDRIREAGAGTLTALYGPEHGVRGDAQAGEYVPYYMDKKYGIPVFSLYGPSMKPQAGMLKGIDEFMRSFDTTHADKKPVPAMTKDLDVLVFDIQDVGTRVYTYEATMAYAMEACAESGLDFIVLDRPNPITGTHMEGPVLEHPKFSSFVGIYPIPLRFGLTMGELARYYNDRFLKKKARLTVVPMENWRRDMWFDETGLPWVTPSPNMPTPETAAVYPGQVFLEGTNVSEGRGTTRPFEYFGAPWIDGHDLAASLNALDLPGVVFREQWYTPVFSKFQGQLCGGCQIHVVDRNAYRPLETTLRTIAEIRRLYPDKFAFHADYFDKIMGTDSVRLALEKGTDVSVIVQGWQPGLAAFAEASKSYRIYD